MIELGASNEHQMIADFLLAEIRSTRFAQFLEPHLAASPHWRILVERPNVDDVNENAVRRNLLAYRGYPDAALFTGFPANPTWHKVRLEWSDFERMRYAREGRLVALAGASRRLLDGAKNFIAGGPAAAAMAQIQGIADAIDGGATFPALIAAQDADGSLILIEGHSRATAYVMKSATADKVAIVARAPSFAAWRYY